MQTSCLINLGCVSQKHRKTKLIVASLVSIGLRCTETYDDFGKHSPVCYQL